MGDERNVIVGCAFLAVLWAKYADLLTASIASNAMYSVLQINSAKGSSEGCSLYHTMIHCLIHGHRVIATGWHMLLDLLAG